LLLGLGIDPNSDNMEVKVKMREAEEKQNGGPPAESVGGEGQRGRRLSGKLLDAFTLLCQARERFMSHLYEGRHQGSGSSINDGGLRQAVEAILARDRASRTKPTSASEECDSGNE
jgi:hypothetical protein